MDRRKFLLLSMATCGSFTLGRGFLAPAFAAPAEPGESPYGPLLSPDTHGLRVPEGFKSRVIKQWNLPIGNTTEFPMLFPDGAATFPTEDGGWILVCNSENPPPSGYSDPTGLGIDQLGGVQSIRFDASGTIIDAYTILDGTRSNCAGGVTPWGTWLSCEEADDETDPSNAGRVWECDPFGVEPAVAHSAMGHFEHENAAIDDERQQVYLSEDANDGLFYRYTPEEYPDLSSGSLEAAVVADDGSVTWVEIPDPTCADGVPCRYQVTATPFAGGEGCAYDAGVVFLDTKRDNKVWAYDVVEKTMTVLYDANDFEDPVLTGVDHMIVQPGTGNLLIAEDGGDLQVVMIRRSDFAVFPVVQLTGEQHGEQLGAVVDEALGSLESLELPSVVDDAIGSFTQSEVSGLAFSPDGTRLYLSSMRGFAGGITYEVQGPWLDRLQQQEPSNSTTTTTIQGSVDAGPSGASEQIPATGGGALGPGVVGVVAAAAAAAALRRRLDRQFPSSVD